MRRYLLPLILLFLSPSTLAAASPDLAAAIDDRDPAGLAAAAEASGAEARLARAVAKAWRGQDEAAEAALRSALGARGLSADLKRRAWLTLGGLYLRTGQFAQAAAALGEAGVEADPDAAAGNAQTRAFAAALASAPAMTVEVGPPSDVPIVYDIAGLPRAPVSVNGVRADAILDTGANFSTINESTAARMGLAPIGADVSVGGVANADVASRLAIAEMLQFGGARFRDVVFIVLPDAALSFAGGRYTIDMIIGIPVLRSLQRLEVRDGGDGATLRYRPSNAKPGPESNLMFDALHPVVTVGAGEARLRLLLDTGANGTQLAKRAVEEFPAIAVGAERRPTEVGGAGGSATHEDALSLPSLTLTIAGKDVTIEEVSVVADRSQRHGILGQDAMRGTGGYVMDFKAMRFELSPPG